MPPSSPKAVEESFAKKLGEADASSPTQATAPILTEEQKNKLKELGYLSMEKITSAEDVAYIRGVLVELFESKTGYEQGLHFNMIGAEDDSNAPSIPQILRPQMLAASLRETEFHRTATAVAREILGPKAEFKLDHVLMKPAINGPATPPHQDEAFHDPSYDCNEISIWMPLQPVDDVNGCMEFYPRTHLGEILPHRSPNNDPRIHGLECWEGFDPAQKVACPIPAGGCTIHFGRTLHSAGQNRSQAPRYAYVLIFEISPVFTGRAKPFPWNQEKDTPRMKRETAWRRRQGLTSLMQTPVKDYWRFIPKAWKKAQSLLKK